MSSKQAFTILSLAVSAAAASAAPTIQPWTTYQGNALHTGYVPVTLDAQKFAKAWAVAIGAGSNLNAVVAADGMVFVTNTGYFSSQGLFVLKARDGSTLWSQAFPDIFSVNPPAYDNGAVYIQTVNNTPGTFVWGYDVATGATIFQTALTAQWEHYLAPTIVDHTLYMDGGEYGGMYSVNGATGAQNWFDSQLSQYDQWTPAVQGRYAYGYLGEMGLVTVDRATGVNRSVIADPSFSWSGYSMNVAPALGSQNDALVYNGGRLIAFDLATQSIRWTQSDGFDSQPSVVPGVVYATDKGALTARSEATGAALWSLALPNETLAGPLVVTDSHVFVSGAAATYAVDLGTHKATWSYPAAGQLSLSEGNLYIAGADGTLTAISVGSARSGGANLALKLADKVVTGGANSYFDFVAGVSNKGPSNATNVVLDIKVPTTVGVASLDPACRLSGQDIHCAWTSLASGQMLKPTFQLVPEKSGTFAVSGAVSATQYDPFSRNNKSVAKITVN